MNDEAQLEALVKKAFIVITTVGPYCLYGEPIFKLCAETGTHYLDCTGEVPWVARMIKKYESKAKSSGAIMIPQAGIESAPPDLVTWSMAQHLRKDLNASTKDAIVTIHKLKYVYHLSSPIIRTQEFLTVKQLQALRWYSSHRPGSL